MLLSTHITALYDVKQIRLNYLECDQFICEIFHWY